MNSFIQIGKLELWISSIWDWDVSDRKSCCGCFISSWGFVGFTWLSKDCARDLDEPLD